MKEYISKGIICIKDKYDIVYHLCVITYILYEDDTFEYIFEPNYSVVGLLPTSFFDTLPGINLDLKKKKYIRKNITPTFISERVVGKNREDYFELLKERNMDFMDPIIYMIRSKKQYSGDRLFVVEYKDKNIVNIDIKNDKTNMAGYIKKILLEIGKGNDIRIVDTSINDDNRKQIYNLLYTLYSKSIDYNKKKQKEGISKAKSENKYKGRKPIRIEGFKVLEMANRVKNKELSSKEAAKALGISIDKYYRELKKLQKLGNKR